MSVVGTPLERTDGRLKVTGQARYAAEFGPRRCANAVAVQSTVARGTITSIDAAAAHRMPGVLAIVTHQNAPALHKPEATPGNKDGHAGENLLPLSGSEIFFAGQYVALVVAERLEQARRAASVLQIAYASQPPVVTFEQASSAGKKPAEAFDQKLQLSKGDVEAALSAPGAVRIDATYTTPVLTHNPMELSGTVAQWQGEDLLVYDSTQAVMGSRAMLAKVFDLAPERVRLVCPFVGGGFGCKGFQWPHTILAALGAKVTGRPVRLVVTRAQMFTSVGHRPPTVQKMSLSAERDGKLTAVRHDTTTATSPVTEFVEPCGKSTSAELYACDNIAVPHHLVRVNVAAPAPMRAPGEASGTFAIESAMDELAVALGMDPIALRLRNNAETHPMTGKPWSSKALTECYALGAERFGWNARTPAPRSMRDGRLLVGWGMATAIYPGNRRPASARIRISSDGRALVQAATQDLGTGSYTIFTQISADALGLPAEKLRFELGDTRFPPAPTSGGSASAASVSEAILQAAAVLKENLAAIARAGSGSPLSGVAASDLAFADGKLVVAAAPDRGMALEDLVRRSGQEAIEVTASAEVPDPKDRKTEIRSFGAQFCEVKVDPELPRVQVGRWVSVMNVGRVLNPRTGRSQVLGGVTMGIGMALMEHTAYDERTGRPVTASLADYLVPVNADIADIEVHFVGGPDPDINTLGCRGLGEIGITGAAAAVANAVYHATGMRVRDLPITPDKLLQG